MAEIKPEAKLSADGPYIIYSNDGSVRIITVDNNGKITDNNVGPLPSDYTFQVATTDGAHKFDVSLHAFERPQWDYPQSAKTFVCSDPHGNFECFVSMLFGNGIIGDDYSWTFGANHLVIEGDVFDRGDDVLPIFWLIYKLEAEASKAGGNVSFILGNHEPLCLMNDNRYTKPKYMLLADKLGMQFNEMWGLNTELGRWLSTRNAMMRIGRCLFVHAGLGSDFFTRNLSVEQVNLYATLGLYKTKAERKDDGELTYFIHGSYGPIWYRGMVRDEEKYLPITSDTLSMLLDLYEVDRVIVGHTIFDDITSFYDGRVIAVNVDNKKNHKHGRGRAILIEADKITICSDDKRLTELR